MNSVTDLKIVFGKLPPPKMDGQNCSVLHDGVMYEFEAELKERFEKFFLEWNLITSKKQDES